MATGSTGGCNNGLYLLGTWLKNVTLGPTLLRVVSCKMWCQ